MIGFASSGDTELCLSPLRVPYYGKKSLERTAALPPKCAKLVNSSQYHRSTKHRRMKIHSEWDHSRRRHRSLPPPSHPPIQLFHHHQQIQRARQDIPVSGCHDTRTRFECSWESISSCACSRSSFWRGKNWSSFGFLSNYLARTLQSSGWDTRLASRRG